MKFKLGDLIAQARFQGGIHVLDSLVEAISDCKSVSDVQYCIAETGLRLFEEERKYTISKEIPVINFDNIEVDVPEDSISLSFEEVKKECEEHSDDKIVSQIKQELVNFINSLSEEDLED